MYPRDRRTAEQELNNNWIKQKSPGAKNVILKDKSVDSLRGLRSANMLKKAAITVVASDFNEDQIKGLTTSS
jgi:hypothetical protein